MSFLAHHGIKGQKWGVRRFQNADGSLTEEGKQHIQEQRRIQMAARTNDKVTDIIKSMTPDDLYNLGYTKEEIARGDPAEQLAGPTAGKSVAKRFIVEYGDKPVSFLDLEEFTVDGEKILNAVIGTRSGEEYRGKGFASQAVKEATVWFDKNADRYDYTEINWGARSTNEASKKLAEKSGFESRGSSEEGWDDYAYRRKRVKHTDIKEESLMDMSYEDFLEHHGIKGQKWGVRKYQNDDGSLTPAGRLRYGVSQARDAAVATVKKVASATGNAAKKVAIATGHGVAKAGKATANKVSEAHAARKAEKREQKIREWSTDLEELKKHQTELTDDEFKEALNRANMNRQLSDLKKAELDRGLSYLKSAAQATGDTLTLANNVSKMITGKSFEDLRKGPSEKEKIELEAKRLGVISQQAITDKNIAAQKEQEAKTSKAEFELQRAKESSLADRWKDKDAAEVAQREYKQKKEQRDAIDEAMRQVKEHDAQVEANRKAGAEKAQRTKEENAYRKEVRATNEYKEIYDSVEKSQKKKLADDYKKNYAVSAAEANKMADEAVERLADWYFDRKMSLSVFDDPNYLEHYGVKGQKWGVRKADDSSSLATVSFNGVGGGSLDENLDQMEEDLEAEEQAIAAMEESLKDLEPGTTADGVKADIDAKKAELEGKKKRFSELKQLVESVKRPYAEFPGEIYHHGIKGQKWGVRRFQNVDGSLTEEGKMHRQKYISKETEKNNAYYAKYEAKYQKLADKAKSDEERAQYLAMKADATKSKNQVNDYLKNMSFDQILANEKESRDKAIKTATTAAKVGLMGISMAGGVAGIATGVRAGVAGATMAVSFLSNPDNQAKLVNNAMKYAEMGIRTAVDIKQWMVGVTIDEMAQNIGKYTNPDDFRVVGEAAGKVARSMSEGFSSTSGDAVSKATEKIAVSAVSGATKAVEQHGGDTGMAALKIAANLAKETARTSGEISGDVAVTAQNINDVATLITNAGKIKHSDISDDYLEHHGIKGQKWGVRRFQDYDGHRIGAKRKETFGASKTVAYDPKTANTTDHHANDNETQHKARLITKAVSSAGLLAVGVALTATGFLPVHGVMAAGTGALGLGESAAALVKVKLADEKVKKLAAEREANTNVDKKTGLKLKSSEMSEKEDLKRVNPGFNNWNTNTKSNCMLCTTAYDMRRRGFDVQAKTASVGYGYDDVNVWYPKAKVVKIEHKKTLMDEMGYTHSLTRDTKKILAAQGDGARGNIMVHWDMDHGGGGHSMVYEVQKGKVIIRCPQSNQTWKDASILNSCMSVSYARLDNVDFDPKKIKEAVE